jgi:glycine/D-amino acid oxidase-like deaminating enzyme
MERRLGSEAGLAAGRLIAASASRLRALVDEEEIACDLRVGGHLSLTRDVATSASLPELVADWRRVGASLSMLDARACRDALPASRYVCGFDFEEGGTVQPLKLALGLAAAAERHGAQIFERSPALGVERAMTGWRIRTQAGSVTAAQVLIATNGYTGTLWPRLAATGYSLTVGMLLSTPLHVAQLSAFPNLRPFTDLDDQTLFSGHITTDGRYAVSFLPGARPRLPAVGHSVSAKFSSIFPDVPPPQWDKMWFGRLLATPTGLPLIVQAAPGIVAALGCNGYGIAGGVALGEDVAKYIAPAAYGSSRLIASSMRSAPLSAAVPNVLRYILTPIRNLFVR